MWFYVSVCLCVSGCVSPSHVGVTEFVSVCFGDSVSVMYLPVSMWVCVCQCVSVSVCRCVCLSMGVCVYQGVNVSVHPFPWGKVSGVGSPNQWGCVCVLRPVFVSVCRSMSAWVALCGKATGRCGCTPAYAGIHVCLSVSSWAAVCDRPPPGQCGGVLPRGG